MNTERYRPLTAHDRMAEPYICTECGVVVRDTEQHDRLHNRLNLMDEYVQRMARAARL